MKSMPRKPKEPTLQDILKMEIADELGLGDKVRDNGWGELTSAESGRIGGLLGVRLKGRRA